MALGSELSSYSSARSLPTTTLGRSQRGSQVSFAFPNGYAAIQALIANGVIGDFRAPDIMRFGITPLYLSEDDIVQAAEVIERVMTDELWAAPEFATRARVT